MTSDTLTPELLAAVRGGDRDAFQQVFRAWYGRLADYAVRICGNPDAAEDAVQEVFIGVWQRRDSLPAVDQLPAYLHRAVRNRALNQIRAINTAERALQQLAHDIAEAPHADASALEEEVRASVERAVSQLPARTREVFQLSRDQGLTYQQIAQTLEISVKTVETLMGRALRALRERLRPN